MLRAARPPSNLKVSNVRAGGSAKGAALGVSDRLRRREIAYLGAVFSEAAPSPECAIKGNVNRNGERVGR